MNHSTTPMYQRTIAKPVTKVGIGLHSGKEVTLSFLPALVDTGIVFERSDLQNAQVPMNAFLVTDTMMSSNLVKGDARVGTVEHVLSAVAAMGIDNLIIQVSSAEMPIMDGSASVFIEMLETAELVEQPALKKFIKIKKDIHIGNEEKWASLSPSDQGFAMQFEIEFAHPAIQATEQRFEGLFGSDNFINEIAFARTFGFLKDLEYLKQHNLAQGASFDNVIVLDDAKVVNEEGLRHQGEFVRHKTLDAVGDLYIIGHQILGEFRAHKSGHALNNELIRAVLSDESCYEIVTFYDKNACPIAYKSAKNPENTKNLG